MTEKEKMLKGDLYDANNDETLIAERKACKQLCFEYNTTSYENKEQRLKILQKIIKKIGKNSHIEPNFYCDYGYNIKIGDNFYINHNSVFLDEACIKFGDNVFVGPNCGFYTANHPIDAQLRAQGLETAKPITIGNNVWIGGNVCVLGGVHIGDNVVIGAGSVVVKDIPSNCVAVGNPCRVIKNTNV
jgi:maltose O-acetyltransferase